jgi:hypothetical protein
VMRIGLCWPGSCPRALRGRPDFQVLRPATTTCLVSDTRSPAALAAAEHASIGYGAGGSLGSVASRCGCVLLPFPPAIAGRVRRAVRDESCLLGAQLFGVHLRKTVVDPGGSDCPGRRGDARGVRAFVLNGAVADVESPRASCDKVVVDVHGAVVCGTDIEFFIGAMADLHQGHSRLPSDELRHAT